MEKLKFSANRETLSFLYLNALYKRNMISNFSDGNGIFAGKIVNVEESGRLVIQTDDGDRRRYYFKEVEYLLI